MILHQAFIFKYNGIVRELKTPIKIGMPSALTPMSDKKNFIQYDAIWDTGANCTMITSKVVSDLGLTPTGLTNVRGVNAESVVSTYMIDIMLPNNVLGTNVIVVEGLPAGCDILIGMNIIQLGDFHISNHEGKTEFSFCMPPHENRIDLVEKSEKVNERIRRNHRRLKINA